MEKELIEDLKRRYREKKNTDITEREKIDAKIFDKAIAKIIAKYPALNGIVRRGQMTDDDEGFVVIELDDHAPISIKFHNGGTDIVKPVFGVKTLLGNIYFDDIGEALVFAEEQARLKQKET